MLQGMNYIAGLLLLVTKNEDSTFWLLKVNTFSSHHFNAAPSNGSKIILVSNIYNAIRWSLILDVG